MVKLIQWVGHPQLCAQIVSQFAFMKAMATPDDKNFYQLQDLSLDEIFEKADAHFVHFISYEILIDSDECDLTEKITDFLQDWKTVTDVTAIQQNIHYELAKLHNE